jgi:hypothetical protein
MKLKQQIKFIFTFLLTLLLGAQFIHAKAELVLPQNNIVFTIEQNQKINFLEKEVQPNIGFLKEKYRFVASESVSVQNTYYFSESFDERLANGVVKFTTKQIDDFVLLATKQNNKLKVMLGKFDNGASTSYVSRAGTTHAYFDMGNKWDEALQLVNGDLDEMWKINKQFIDEQKALSKEFYLSHNPANATGFYKREIDYLTIDLKGKVVQINNNTWKIQW